MIEYATAPFKWIGQQIDVGIPDALLSIFDKMGDFIQSIQIFGLNVYIVFLVLLYFALIIGLIYVPIKLYPMYLENKTIINKIVGFVVLK